MRGHNNIKSDLTKTFSTLKFREALVSELSVIDDDLKIQRYPDGNESLTEKFDMDHLESTISMWKTGQVKKVILRASFDDIIGSILAFERLEKDFEVLYVELHNEPWFYPTIRPKTRKEFWMSIFNKNKYHELKARQYSTQAKSMINIFRNHNHFLGKRFAIASPIPYVAKWRIWYETLKKELGPEFKTAAVHIYGQPWDNDWEDKIRAALRVMKSDHKELACTEYNAIHWGKNGSEHPELWQSETHAIYTRIVEDIISAHCTVGILHKFYGYIPHRYFARLNFNGDGSVTDRSVILREGNFIF